MRFLPKLIHLTQNPVHSRLLARSLRGTALFPPSSNVRFFGTSFLSFFSFFFSKFFQPVLLCNVVIDLQVQQENYTYKPYAHFTLFHKCKKTWLLGLPSQHHDHIRSRICLFSQPYLPSSSSSAGSTMPTDHILDRWLVAPSPSIGTANHINKLNNMFFDNII